MRMIRGKTFPVQLEQDDGGSPTLPSITLVGLPEWDQLALRHWGLEERAKALDLYAKVAKAITRAFEKWQRLIEERHVQIRVIKTGLPCGRAQLSLERCGSLHYSPNSVAGPGQHGGRQDRLDSARGRRLGNASHG